MPNPPYASLIRDIPDFPRAGVLFRDITPLLGDAEGFAAAVRDLAAPYRDASIDRVVAVEARGYLLGAPVALELGAGLVPVRKKGKLPYEVLRAEYTLEYGEEAVEVHSDALRPGERVLIVDDVLATGGTMAAAAALAERTGAAVAGAAVLIELTGLRGRDRLRGMPLTASIVY